MNSDIVLIKRALISVSDKTDVIDFARGLERQGVEIISTGGTRKALADAGIAVTDISTFTGFPEIMDGRVKTLHPLVHGGILGLRDMHADIAQQQDIDWIDLVVCNLYPFSHAITKSGVTIDEAIEHIDIGGPSMIRSAAKNIGWVGVVVDPADYAKLLTEIESGGLSFDTRKRLSAKAFGHTAQYDAIIHRYFSQEQFPESLNLTYTKLFDVRYGENPHQTASVYRAPHTQSTLLDATILQGKQLSYNNLNDADGALSLLREFQDPACVIVKHANPCGVAIDQSIDRAFYKAYHADALSAFGGIIALNRDCTVDVAESINKFFAEIVIAPAFDQATLALLSQKKNLRLLATGQIHPLATGIEYRFIDGGLLAQDTDARVITAADLRIVTQKKPTAAEIADMLFAWRVVKHMKSNAILIANNQTTVGVGVGQVSRVDAVDIAIKKSPTGNLAGCVLASDAFFPFRDSIDKLAATGISAIIQPGGSVKDEEVIAACNDHGIAMVFTGVRCFKH